MCGGIPQGCLGHPRGRCSLVAKYAGASHAYTRQFAGEHLLLPLAQPRVHPAYCGIGMQGTRQGYACSYRPRGLRSVQSVSRCRWAIAVGSGSKGISSTKNPSERRCGRIRFNQIIGDLPAVLVVLTRMQVYFQANARVSVAAMLKVLGNSCIYTSSVTYKNVRVCVSLQKLPGGL